MKANKKIQYAANDVNALRRLQEHIDDQMRQHAEQQRAAQPIEITICSLDDKH